MMCLELESFKKLNLSFLFSVIDRRFQKNDNAVKLSSIHRAKGLEADSVFLLAPDRMPSTYATSPDDVYAELCLQFVALTRSKRDLYFVEVMDVT